MVRHSLRTTAAHLCLTARHGATAATRRLLTRTPPTIMPTASPTSGDRLREESIRRTVLHNTASTVSLTVDDVAASQRFFTSHLGHVEQADDATPRWTLSARMWRRSAVGRPA